MINLDLPWQHAVEKITGPQRLDIYLSQALKRDRISRSTIQRLIREGWVTLINNSTPTGTLVHSPSHQIQLGDSIQIDRPQLKIQKSPASDIQIPILFENNDFLAIDKPAGLMTHPTSSLAFRLDAQLANDMGVMDKPSVLGWVLKKFPDNKDIPRYGLIHRLDAGTSGVLLIAKTLPAFEGIQQLFASKEIKKTYLALVSGVCRHEQITISKAVAARYDKNRMTMTIAQPWDKPRSAVTNAALIKAYANASLLEVHPLTGRTHQIRIHLSSIGHPIIGDIIYQAKKQSSGPATKILDENPEQEPGRLMLHAWKIRFAWPKFSKMTQIISPVPKNFKAEFLRHTNHRLPPTIK